MRRIRYTPRRAPLALALLTLALTALSPAYVSAQCTGPVQTSTQTTSISSSGNNAFALPFNQYNPPTDYQLVGAEFSSYITVNATVDMTNNTGSDMSNVKLSILDEDQF